MMELWNIEKEYFDAGLSYVCGVDEAGAGPLAGPVYAAAVILPPFCEIPGLNDSKKLTEKKREQLFDVILEKAVAYSIARVEAEEIDATDILSARMKAMQLAIDGLTVQPRMALIDGNRDKGKSAAITVPHVTVIGGDGKSASIAAASILAKVSRDRYVVEELERDYPQYQFAKHKGYGTKLHYDMLDQYGPCAAHRKTFLKKVGGEEGMSRATGTWGEAQVAAYLRKKGYQLVAHSYHCRFGEIDLIAQKGKILCFVEVKTRSNLKCGLPRDYVTAAKQEKLRKTAAFYLSDKELDCPVRFDVAEVYSDTQHSPESVRIEYLENAF